MSGSESSNNYKTVSCITYNILAHIYTDAYSKLRYPHIENPDILDWSKRLDIIRKKIKNADIICLQEVVLETIKSDFINYFPDYDYFHHVKCKERTCPIGNLILWKKTFKCIDSFKHSCGVYVTLIINNKEIRIGNIHLAAGIISQLPQRINQLKSCIKNFGNNPGVICGDFNDELENNPGNIKEIKENKENKENKNDYDLNNYELKSMLDNSNFVCHNNSLTCCVYNKKENIHKFWKFDNIASHNINVKIGKICDSKDYNLTIPKELINIEPSDHFMIPFEIFF